MLYLRYTPFPGDNDVAKDAIMSYLKQKIKILLYVAEGDGDTIAYHDNYIIEGKQGAIAKFMTRTNQECLHRNIERWTKVDKNGKKVTTGMHSLTVVENLESLVLYLCKGRLGRKNDPVFAWIVHDDIRAQFGSPQECHVKFHERSENYDVHVQKKARKDKTDNWTEEVIGFVLQKVGLEDNVPAIGAGILECYHAKGKLFPNKYYMETLIQTCLFRINDKKDKTDMLTPTEMFARLYPSLANTLS